MPVGNSKGMLLLAAIVGLSLIGVAGIVAIEVSGVEQPAPSIAQIIGFVAPVLVALIALLRSTMNAESLDQLHSKVDRVEKKQNGNKKEWKPGDEERRREEGKQDGRKGDGPAAPGRG
jgi:hypothetical protein